MAVATNKPILSMANFQYTSPLYLGALAAGGVVLYLACLSIYRLYLSPIAKFPGPKLAALTLWYEFYHDVVRGGQYCFKINELHDQYGTEEKPPLHSYPPQTRSLNPACFRTNYPDQPIRTTRARPGFLRCAVQRTGPETRQVVVVRGDVWQQFINVRNGLS